MLRGDRRPAWDRDIGVMAAESRPAALSSASLQAAVRDLADSVVPRRPEGGRQHSPSD